MALEKWFLRFFLKVKNQGKAVYGNFYQIQNLGEITLGEASKNLKSRGNPVRGNMEEKIPQSRFRGNVRGNAHFPKKKPLQRNEPVHDAKNESTQ